MSQLQRVEGEVELKCDADKFFDVWARKLYLAHGMSPEKVPKMELIEGEWHKVGAVMVGHYYISNIGERAFLKTRVEELDEENKLVRYSYHDGQILKSFYKTLKSMIQITPKGEGCIVKWSCEYEKMNEDVPEPNAYLDFMLDVAKDIDGFLCKGA
uniref:Bet v I/Major latex protein domain-containing protein n=2 Tax=Chenopodium quinoa TaxID=63459 RepID=A0A803LBS8_CHEQI